MRTLLYCALVAATACGATAAQAQTAYNSTPTDTWHNGDGNDYSPANTAVLTTEADNELYLRFHQTYVPAPASVGNLYSFALGLPPVGDPDSAGQLSFDWGVDAGDAPEDLFGVTGKLTLTNLGNGMNYEYDPFFILNDNSVESGSAQNSFRFNWVNDGLAPFIAPHPGFFDPNIDGLYRVQLDVFGLDGVDSAHSLYADAQIGAGVAAVPEPATWAMMLLGMGLVGGVMRRKAKTAVRVRYA